MDIEEDLDNAVAEEKAARQSKRGAKRPRAEGAASADSSAGASGDTGKAPPPTASGSGGPGRSPGLLHGPYELSIDVVDIGECSIVKHALSDSWVAIPWQEGDKLNRYRIVGWAASAHRFVIDGGDDKYYPLEGGEMHRWLSKELRVKVSASQRKASSSI